MQTFQKHFFILELHKFNTFLNFWISQNQHFSLTCIFFQHFSYTFICANFPKTFLYFRITQIQHFSKFLDFTKSTLFSDLYFFPTFFLYLYVCKLLKFLDFRISQNQHFFLTCIFFPTFTLCAYFYMCKLSKNISLF